MFEGENVMTHQYLLGMVNQNSNPVLNAEIHYTAYGSYKYKTEVLDGAEEGLPKKSHSYQGIEKVDTHFKKC